MNLTKLATITKINICKLELNDNYFYDINIFYN